MLKNWFNQGLVKSAAAKLDRTNHVLASKPMQTTIVQCPTRTKSDHVAVLIVENAEMHSSTGVKIKNLHGNEILPKVDSYHTHLWDPKTETIDKVVTSSPEYPIGRPNACLNLKSKHPVKWREKTAIYCRDPSTHPRTKTYRNNR